MAIYTESERRDAAALGENLLVRTRFPFRLPSRERIPLRSRENIKAFSVFKKK
jgi:hypothetical protein